MGGRSLGSTSIVSTTEAPSSCLPEFSAHASVFLNCPLSQVLPKTRVKSHQSAMECARELLEEEGPKALFKGGLARALRIGPQLGITLVVYDWLCHLN